MQPRRTPHFSLVAAILAVSILLSGFGPGRAGAQAPLAPGAAAVYSAFLPLVALMGPPAGSPPAISSFTASPSSITAGQSSTLSWSVSGADSLSLSPGIGAVTGSSKPVTPSATTEYTLVATNAYGTASAKVTVTVTSAGAPSGGFFITPIGQIDRPTSRPTVAVDGAGGVHVAYTMDSAVSGTARAAYYAYCPGNCTSAAAFTRITLGDNVEYANLALDNLGRPRLLLQLSPPSTSVWGFEYWSCDSSCTQPAQWTSSIVGFAFKRSVAWSSFGRYFAIDAQGRPRFVYYDAGQNYEDPHWGVFYAYCNSNCTQVVNWQETRVLADGFAEDFYLTLSPAGQPRLAYSTYDKDAALHWMGYAECNASCEAGANWSSAWLVNTVSASVSESESFALRTDSSGRPRIALYVGTGVQSGLPAGILYYLSCNAVDCSQLQSWYALDLSLPKMHGEAGVDLALDAQDRPRIALHGPLTAGFGLFYAWCNTNCLTSSQGWQEQKLEPSEKVDAELPIPPAPGCAFPVCDPPQSACTLSFWDSGVRPALALDAAGNPRIAYDANHEQGGGCTTHTDTRLTRFIQLNQP